MSGRVVVLLPGIWMPSAEMYFLGRRLARHYGHDVRLFDYRSVRNTLDQNAADLGAYAAGLDAEHLDLVGHSLGGVVALRALAAAPELPPGRVVCLGSPMRGSQTARVLQASALGRAIVGRSLAEAIVGRGVTTWSSEVTRQREVGVVAGNTPVGIGRLFTRFDGRNDGTVAVAETLLAGLRDHIELPVTHTGMVFSSDVADQAAVFLERGRFRRGFG